MNLMKESGIQPDEIAYGAAIDAHRRAGNSLLALECLSEMQRKSMEPSAAHYNLVLRTLKTNGYAEKMYRMLISLCNKENVRLNANTYELTIEALLEQSMWKEALVILKLMNQSVFVPSLEVSSFIFISAPTSTCAAILHVSFFQTCTRFVTVLEKARQYKAVLAVYRLMDTYGYDLYENDVLNGNAFCTTIPYKM
jgi:pentatricopeptide repeat protein